MKGRFGGPTPQEKILSVSQNLGLPGIKKQQGATRFLYDSLPLDGSKTFEFFKNPDKTTFPLFSNVDGQNYLLGTGETLVAQWIAFRVMTLDALDATSVTGLLQPSASAIVGFEFGFYAGTFAFTLANVTVLKPTSTSVFDPVLNPSMASSFDLCAFNLFTETVIPQNVQFIVNLQVQKYTTAEDTFLQCIIGGVGSVLAPRQTF